MKFICIVIPTKKILPNAKYIKEFDVYLTDPNQYGIRWKRYGKDSTYPKLIQEVAHVVYEVDNLEKAVEDKEILVNPNVPNHRDDLKFAVIAVDGAPVEFVQFINK
ncbi:MAG TPA: hypothetical protein QF753_22465 [Victivallales bacterium]|nr:hypothetical protein [Victivallales bacterium]